MLEQENKITLIEYADFFGSIQIFNYLRKNGAELESSLWIYAVHGQNPEIINFLEENKIFPSKNDVLTFKKIFMRQSNVITMMLQIIFKKIIYKMKKNHQMIH